jgi:hypothetical protein
MYTDLSKKPIYDNAKIGFSADFFSPLKRERIASRLSEALRRRVLHSDVYKAGGESTDKTFKLFPNFFGGFKMNTLETGPMPYNEGLNVLIKAMNAIDEMGFTTQKCKMKIRVWHDATPLGGFAMEHINIPRFMLNLNEASILEFWKKNGSNRVWQSSLRYVYPKNVFMTDLGPGLFENANMTSMRYPSSKFFGVGFDGIKNGYVELRYVGGQHYQRRKQQIVDLVNNVIETTNESLMPRGYSEEERNKVLKIVSEQREIVESMKTYESFHAKYPLISLYVDLRNNDEILTQRFADMREKLFDLVVYGNMKAGSVNLDTTRGRMQVRESYIHDGFSISGVDFFLSKVEGDFNDCAFQSCSIRGSSVRNSALHSNNVVHSSAMFECSFIGGSNILQGSYVDNGADKPIEADIRESIIRRGVVTMNSTVDDSTEMIEAIADKK